MTLGRITALGVSGDFVLTLSWDDGYVATVDLAPLLHRRADLARLREPQAFACARRSEDGWSVEWPDFALDFGAPQLRRWAHEQAGEAMTLTDFKAWLSRHRLSAPEAARTLGLPHRDVERFLSGEAAIPKTVMLATEGYDKRQAA